MTPSLDNLFEGRPPRTAFHGIYDLSETPRIHAYEALMRGPSGLPFEGPMLAFAFAHSMDLLRELDLECVRRALEVGPRDRRLFLNLHPITLKGGGVEDVIALAEASGRPPHELVFELVEHGPDQESEIIGAMSALRRAGYGLAVDDFGEGASNLRRLLQLRPDYLKLDRWFVNDADRDPGRRAVVRATAQLGKDLGIQVVAEGVRSEVLMDLVHSAGINLVQCYQFQPPGLHDPLAEIGEDHEAGQELNPSMPGSPMLNIVDSLEERSLDALPFGAIQLASDGTILQYNRYEEDLARRKASDVIGKNFFTQVAPCTDVREFAGRF
ncbi:MAG: EAL domain-containing protein, partial [Holophaga sp.]|nr:EAL domain-containing protein [Holophaga sp.]